ncbi:hypothetical protein [Clostridium sp. CF012]|uniref:hypothetical protein n=1 Tax=Clostridium sp. CF012 TaxID=2843319 RepID=UPI001C0BBD6A|nr:hypothetical protein [Clostridium sp. CF012]MBU3143867.1 hypothetical protein [Clostridium sp. CF012]
MDYDIYKQYLIKEYKDKVQKVRNISEVIDYLNHIVNLNKIEPPSEASPIFYNITKFNFLNCTKNKDLNLTIEEFEFEAYEVVHDEKSENYYEENNKVNKGSPIIVFVEKRLGAITSTCEPLKQQLHIAEGISEYHIENETPEFFDYLILLDIFKKKKI